MSTSDCDRLRKSAAIIKERLDWCLSAHTNTRCTNDTQAAAPKRLIYLDPLTQTARLVPTPSPLPKYAILSYVWGPEEDNLRTLTSNIDQMHASIPSSSLPLTLQHIFQLVKLLSLSYLWVDALCIIQDCDLDKSTEIANMASTYINAFLQIAATSSPGARHGLFAPADNGQLTIDEHHDIMKVCRSLRQRDWDTTLYDHYRLLTRGWTFQERILARRCVHFTEKELVWECKTARWCECGEIGATLDGCGLINNMSASLELCRELFTKGVRKGKVSPLWRECVMSYSKRNLGHAEDRLVAISGIALLLQPGPGGDREYLAGMWEESMPFDLLWRCDQSSILKERKVFRPSWSWGSVHCGVYWPKAKDWQRDPAKAAFEKKSVLETSLLEPSPEAQLAHLTSETYFEVPLKGVPVRRVEVKAIGSQFGQIEWGFVVLLSRKVPIRIRKLQQHVGQGSHQTGWVVERMGSSLPFYPDIQFAEDGCEIDVKGNGEYWLVEIARGCQGDEIWEAGLVVRQAIGQDGAYQRVGMAGHSVCEPRKVAQWFVSELEPEEISLV